MNDIPYLAFPSEMYSTSYEHFNENSYLWQEWQDSSYIAVQMWYWKEHTKGYSKTLDVSKVVDITFILFCFDILHSTHIIM